MTKDIERDSFMTCTLKTSLYALHGLTARILYPKTRATRQTVLNLVFFAATIASDTQQTIIISFLGCAGKSFEQFPRFSHSTDHF